MPDQHFLLGPNAKDRIREMLVKQKPGTAINLVQEQNGLTHANSVIDVSSIYPLLDHHGHSRYEVHLKLKEALMEKLLNKIETTQLPPEKNTALLHSMLEYIDVKGLQELPLKLLAQNPSEITPELIEKIGSNNELFSIAPIVIKRTIWLSNPEKFRLDIHPHVNDYKDDPFNIRSSKEMSIEQPATLIAQRRSHPSIKKILDLIGGDHKLYDFTNQYLRARFIQTNDPAYCTLKVDLLMALIEANDKSVYLLDLSHELVWSLDTCNRTLSMDDRRVERIRKFFDSVVRDSPEHGDIAMVLNDPFTSNMLASRLLSLLNDATQTGNVAHKDVVLIWTATMLNLGSHARRILDTKKYRIPKVEQNVSETFMATLTNCILDDTISTLNKERDETVVNEDVKFGQDNMLALDQSEVARKVLCHYILNRLVQQDTHALIRTLPTMVKSLTQHLPRYDSNTVPIDMLYVTYHSFLYTFITMLQRQTLVFKFFSDRAWYTLIMDEVVLPCVKVYPPLHDDVATFLMNLFRAATHIIAGSAQGYRQGPLMAEGLAQMGRWIETLYSLRPTRGVTTEQEEKLRTSFAAIVSETALFAGGRFKIPADQIPTLLKFVQVIWDRQEQQMAQAAANRSNAPTGASGANMMDTSA